MTVQEGTTHSGEWASEDMTAAALVGEGQVDVRRIPVPPLAAGHALVRVNLVGLCGTDLEMLHGTAAYVVDGRARFPWVFGHEWVGTVVALDGPGHRLRPGQRVVGQTMVPCDACPTCRSGRRSLCPHMNEIGLYGLQGAAAEYIAVPTRALVPVPDTVPDREAVFVEPAVTVRRALADTRCSVDDSVAVIGTGTIGLLAVMMARVISGQVVAIGVDDAGLELGFQLGADKAVQSGSEDPRKYSVVIEASGTGAGLREAIRVADDGARIAVVGVADEPVGEFPAAQITLRGISLLGIRHGLDFYDQTLEMFASDLIDTAPLISSIHPLHDVARAFHALAHERCGAPKVLVSPQR